MTRPFARVPVFGVGVTPCTYAETVEAILDAAQEQRAFGVAALATHGLMTAVHESGFHAALDRLDVVTPDGQPVRWALNLIASPGLAERVYGPELTERVCAAAADRDLSLYLFGSTEQTCKTLAATLLHRFPGTRIAGIQPDRFRDATPEEDAADVQRIIDSGASIVLVGRGCPRQERWVADHLDRVPAAMLAVGAAFDYIAGTLARPPHWMQRFGLEWLHRLLHEPRRLWKRYLVTNSQFIVRFVPLWFRVRVLRSH